MKTAAQKTTKIEKSEDTITKYGRPCIRVGFRGIDKDGNETRFAWAEQSFSHERDGWSAFRWSDTVGPIGISSRAFQTREQAEADAERFASQGFAS